MTKVDKMPNDTDKESKAVDSEKKSSCSWRYWSVRLAILLVLITLIVLMIVFRDWVSETTQAFLEWLGDNPVEGTICLSLIYIVATLIFLPGSLLTLGAGVAL